MKRCELEKREKKKDTSLTKYMVILWIAGFAGLIISLASFYEFREPVMKIIRLTVFRETP